MRFSLHVGLLHFILCIFIKYILLHCPQTQYKDVFYTLRNTLNFILMPLFDAHKQTTPSARILANIIHLV